MIAIAMPTCGPTELSARIARAAGSAPAADQHERHDRPSLTSREPPLAR